jgi:predicted nucleic acid-binding protein
VLIADTSGLLASIDRNDRHHEAVRQIVLNPREVVVIPELVLAELDYLVLKHLGREAEEALLDDIVEKTYPREPCYDQDMARARELIHIYREHDIGLVDATILATAERMDVPRILTLDHRHFRTMKLMNRKPVIILPADSPRRRP